MGVEPSKIDDRQRVKIYKRVNFAEARKLFAELTKDSKCKKHTSADPLFDALDSPPTSQNFYAYFQSSSSGSSTSTSTNNSSSSSDGKGKITLHLDTSKGIEMFIEHSASVYSLLHTEWWDGRKITIVPSVIPEDYQLGLDKRQYDALYSIIPLSQSSSTSSNNLGRSLSVSDIQINTISTYAL